MHGDSRMATVCILHVDTSEILKRLLIDAARAVCPMRQHVGDRSKNFCETNIYLFADCKIF